MLFVTQLVNKNQFGNQGACMDLTEQEQLSKEAKSLTVEEFDDLVKKLKILRESYDQAKKVASDINTECERLENKLLFTLEETNRTNYKSPNGTISIMHKWRVNNPQTDEDKAALFAHLQERGIFERFATVNNNSINSLYMQDWEAARERGEGMEFKMPGIGEAKLNKVLSFRKA